MARAAKRVECPLPISTTRAGRCCLICAYSIAASRPQNQSWSQRGSGALASRAIFFRSSATASIASIAAAISGSASSNIAAIAG